jgi:hypothetical protein
MDKLQRLHEWDLLERKLLEIKNEFIDSIPDESIEELQSDLIEKERECDDLEDDNEEMKSKLMQIYALVRGANSEMTSEQLFEVVDQIQDIV